MSDLFWDPLGEAPREEPLRVELLQRLRVLDFVGIWTIPALLITAFIALGGAPEGLVLSHVEPTLLSAVTAHFVHRSVSHLTANLAGYAFVVPGAYVMAVLAGCRRTFAVTMVGTLVALPPSLSWAVLSVIDRGVTVGFSGILMAFVGVVPVFIGAFVADRIDGATTLDVGPGLFFLGLAFVSVQLMPPGSARVAVIGTTLILAAGYLFHSFDAGFLSFGWPSGVRSPEAQVVAVGLGVYLFGLLVGFTGDGGRGLIVVNTYGHLFGFTFGFILSYLILRRLDESSWGEGA